MTDQIQQTRQVNSDGTASIKTTEIVGNNNVTARRDSIAARIVWFVAGVIITLLAFRFIFILLGASSASGFVNFIYSASHPFASPFFGIFSYNQQDGEARFELSTLVAITVYLLIAYGIGKLLTIRRPHSTAY